MSDLHLSPAISYLPLRLAGRRLAQGRQKNQINDSESARTERAKRVEVPVAQLVEHSTFNRRVESSNLSGHKFPPP